MAEYSLSIEERRIESIWDWYEIQREALIDFKQKIKFSINQSNIKVNPKFRWLSPQEIDEYFENSVIDLEHLVCFDLISATEGMLRRDFNSKVSKKDKTELGREFREIKKEKDGKISFEDDIISNWKKFYPDDKTNFSNFIGVLKYRHWLAHGRYWAPKLGREYTPEIIYKIIEKVFVFVEK